MRSWILIACVTAALFVLSGCRSAETRNDEYVGMTATISQAQTALDEGNLMEAERQARFLLNDEEYAFDAFMILGEALLRQRKMEEYDNELTPAGKAYLMVESERAREEAKKILQDDSPVGILVMLESLSFTAAFTPERERPNLLGPFIEHLENIVNEGDRALGVLALDVLGGINISASRSAIRRVAEGDDPLFSYLARAYMPPAEIERTR